MSSGLCPRCGDASGERHLCVPPFLDRGPVTYNASAPPMIMHAANAPDLAAIEARAAAATPGPWLAWHNPDPDKYSDPQIWQWQVDQDERVIAGGYRIIKGAWNEADATFIATARADVPALVAEVRRLRALLARYADVIGDDARDVLPGVPF